ncbi:MAG: aldo/keto reductase [Acidobacteria bacterium]|nr:aldo/keto reductase [Acidobacteriota bacterium]
MAALQDPDCLVEIPDFAACFHAVSSNFAGWHIARAQCEAQRRCFMGLVSEQSLYNLATRTIEMEVIPACREFGLGLIPWSPMEGGLLSGALQKAKEGRRSEKRTMDPIRLLAIPMQLVSPS